MFAFHGVPRYVVSAVRGPTMVVAKLVASELLEADPAEVAGAMGARHRHASVGFGVHNMVAACAAKIWGMRCSATDIHCDAYAFSKDLGT